MKRRTVVSKTKLDPYGTELSLVFSDDMVSAGKDLNVEDHESLDDTAGFVAATGNSVVLVVRRDKLTYSTVVHEAQHVVYCVFRFIEQSLEGSEEPACYLLQHIVEYVLSEAKRRKIKIR